MIVHPCGISGLIICIKPDFFTCKKFSMPCKFETDMCSFISQPINDQKINHWPSEDDKKGLKFHTEMKM